MKYYAVPVSILEEHGLGDESWRKRKGDEALASEAEVMERLGYPDSKAFDEVSGMAPMTLREAKEWTENN
ncbi:MAG: hypothetical protein K2N25_01355 [Muribaculaceae bacterium]|nr:hypothetical protein [Muribaculaceae bacterium]